MKVIAKAPVNIALVKYFGKKDPIKVIPYNPSVSFALEDFYTITYLEKKGSPGVSFTINDQVQPEEEHKKIIDFLRHFKGFNPYDGLHIKSFNNVPTAAGFASSASGFAALSICANAYYKTNYDLKTLVKIARMGSGSSVRSLIGGAVLWDVDGMIYPLEANLKAYKMMFVVLHDSQKPISSRAAMKRVVETSALYETFVKTSFEDAKLMIEALKQDQFNLIGKILESNARLMHATMVASNPPFSYLTKETYKVLELVKAMQEEGIALYATMDAGPNVKLLYQKELETVILKRLHEEGFTHVLTSALSKEGARLINDFPNL
ncbi:MAG: diphosphomevalonate decarboxylase [Candidatus Izemoplasmataceae bacterium]